MFIFKKCSRYIPIPRRFTSMFMIVFSSICLVIYLWTLFSISYHSQSSFIRITQERYKGILINNLGDILGTKEDEGVFHQMQEREETFEIKYCNPDSINYKHKITHEDIECKPHTASKPSCDLAKALYSFDRKLKTCGRSNVVHLCDFAKSNDSATVKPEIQCSLSGCQKYNRKNAIIWYLSQDTGKIKKKKELYSDAQSLKYSVEDMAKSSAKMGYNFLFLECVPSVDYKREEHEMIGQLLILPPLSIKNRKRNATYTLGNGRKENTINLNIVLLDSVARSHFYRSLPATLATFNKINGDQHSDAEVLDFKLFQSVEGHTSENLHALFTGTLFPNHYTGYDRETKPVGIGDFFGRFAKNGYQTFYQDDLCYDEYWGMRLELGSPKSWYLFPEMFRENFIDHSGLAFASCLLLSTNKVSNPFNGPSGPLCFNGRFTDAYYLDFTYQHHEFASKWNQKILSYTALNVAHDNTGRRVQSIDYELATYIEKISKLKNTLTILMADHGNTYTHYTHAVIEGRYEQFHPSLFMIVPDGVKNILGRRIMNNLRSNQMKLFTMLDIHHALINIPEKHLNATGIFGIIPAKRTCDDLELRLPNSCVCEGWETAAMNDTIQLSVLNFAVGMLNNKLRNYQKETLKSQSIPKCHRLIPIGFENVRERNKDKYLITSLNFITKGGEGASQNYDVFHVEVQSEMDVETSRNMKLLNFDRISKYGPYKKCADKHMDIRLCICDLKISNKNTDVIKFVTSELTNYPRIFEHDVVMNKEKNACVFLRTISYPEKTEDSNNTGNVYSATYEVMNTCKQDFQIILDLVFENMKTTTNLPFLRKVLEG